MTTNALPPVGVISPAYVPVLSQLTGFVNNQTGLPASDTSQTPIYNNNTVNFFALQVPQHFGVPNVQQYNLTVQRSLGSAMNYSVPLCPSEYALSAASRAKLWRAHFAHAHALAERFVF